MKTKKVVYWVATLLVSAMMTMAAVAYLTHNPKAMDAFASLGYPSYFPTFLGIAKLLGVIALLAPGVPTLKEWAYAGFTFTFVAAFVSHMAMDQHKEAVAPVVASLLLAVSYYTLESRTAHPKDRRQL